MRSCNECAIGRGAGQNSCRKRHMCASITVGVVNIISVREAHWGHTWYPIFRETLGFVVKLKRGKLFQTVLLFFPRIFATVNTYFSDIRTFPQCGSMTALHLAACLGYEVKIHILLLFFCPKSHNLQFFSFFTIYNIISKSAIIIFI